MIGNQRVWKKDFEDKRMKEYQLSVLRRGAILGICLDVEVEQRKRHK